MIGKKLENALNEQIKHELASAYLYLAMAAYFHAEGLDGMGGWMEAQSDEELTHAKKFIDHLVERDGRVELKALAQPKKSWSSPLAAFQAAHKHEKLITSKIDALVDLAAKEKDNAAGVLLQWFVTEQVEEESSTSKVAQMLERIGSSGSGLVMLDKQLGKRATAPAE